MTRLKIKCVVMFIVVTITDFKLTHSEATMPLCGSFAHGDLMGRHR